LVKSSSRFLRLPTIANRPCIEKLDGESVAMAALVVLAAGRGNIGLDQPPGTMPGGKE
jgi:hypothetical protein